MSNISNDEFALEMRNYFLSGVLQLIEELRPDPLFLQKFAELCEDWKTEAAANQLPILALFLQELAAKCNSGSDVGTVTELIFAQLKLYLEALQTEADSEDLKAQFITPTQASEAISSAEETDGKKYLQCRSGAYCFLLPVENVVEIARGKVVHPLPKSDSRIKGLIAFRGVGTPVFYLHGVTTEDTSEKSFFVICEFKKYYFALEVNSTEDVCKLSPKDFQARTFATRNGKILSLMDIPSLVAA